MTGSQLRHTRRELPPQPTFHFSMLRWTTVQNRLSPSTPNELFRVDCMFCTTSCASSFSGAAV